MFLIQKNLLINILNNLIICHCERSEAISFNRSLAEFTLSEVEGLGMTEGGMWIET